MHSSLQNLRLLAVMPLIGVAFSQTPSGFSPAVDTGLNISYSRVDVSKAGELLPKSGTHDLETDKTNKSDVKTAPNITVPTTLGANSTGLIIMMDLDMTVPNATTNSGYTTFLNWLATDIDLSVNPIAIPDGQGAPYYPPSPPGNSSAHRYIFLLFSQPSNFSFPLSYQKISPPLTTSSRMGFDLAAFAIASNLDLPIAADWITVGKQVKNGSGNSTTSAPSKPTSASNATSVTSSTSQPSPKKSSGASALGITASMQYGLFASLFAFAI
jgi:Phosphatidylethanolamine-binding protein